MLGRYHFPYLIGFKKRLTLFVFSQHTHLTPVVDTKLRWHEFKKLQYLTPRSVFGSLRMVLYRDHPARGTYLPLLLMFVLGNWQGWGVRRGVAVRG